MSPEDRKMIARLLRKVLKQHERERDQVRTAVAERDFYNTREAATRLRYKPCYVLELLRNQKLKGSKVESLRRDGKEEWTIAREAIEEYERRRRKPKA